MQYARLEPAMTTISSTISQISPVNERIYHQSNLLGDWKGTWSKNGAPVEFKVINIRGTTAQVEYTHNGHTERGTAEVDGATITFGDVTIGTKDGQNAALEFSVGTAKQSALLQKQAADTDQSMLVGNWSGSSKVNGQSAFFAVTSVDGRDAQVTYTANGSTQKGTGTVYKNTVMFGKAQITSNDGQNGNVILQVGRNFYSIPVTKLKAASSSSSTVNKSA
jgi:ribosomal protein S8E